MSKIRRRVPKYQCHKARNLARVTIDGKDIYLGPYDSPESHAAYEKLIAEWLLRDPFVPDKANELTICELMACYLKHAREYYVKNGEPTREFGCTAEAFRPLRQLYESTFAIDFGPKALKTVRAAMVDLGWSRKYVNKQIARITRMFRWAVSEEFIPVTVHQALITVPGLKKGRTKAKELPPVEPVADAHVDVVVARARPVIAAMIQLQRLTGCRPGEAVMMRPVDLNRNRAIWEYRPNSHKTEHLEKQRVIFIGPKAQQLLHPYLDRSPNAYCFSPIESEQRRRAEVNSRRKTPLNQGNRPRQECVLTFGEHYTAGSYRKAIHRCCDKAGIPRWSPNQLRHTAATEIRREFGLDAAQVILGHSSANTTQIYAEVDRKLAAKVVKKVG